MNRTAFLARLPQGRVPAPARPSGPPEPPPADPIATLAANLRGAGVGVHLVEDAGKALERALALVRESGAARVGVSDLGPEIMAELPAAAAAAGLETLTAGDGQAGPEVLEPLPAGLTRAELAVAQVGAVVQVARPGGGRLLSLLPPLHVVLLDAADVLPAMEDLPRALKDPARFPGALPPAVSLIGGPSKTGDIEAVIVLGVHGPGRVEVVIWR